MADMIEMRASVTSVLYGPAEDGYTMVSLKEDPSGERVVAAGRALPTGIREGDEITVTGRWSQGKKGPYFAVQTARKALPRTTQGIEKWLAKAKVPGVGIVKAAKLVAAFGMETIDAIAEEREEAAAIIGRKQVAKAGAFMRESRKEAEIGSTLSGHGVGGRLQRKILDHYGDRVHNVLTKEPYRLILDIDGVAFQTADKIAQAAGLATDAPERIQAAVVNTLRDAARQGHCALYHQQLMERCSDAIAVSDRLVEAQLETLQNGGHIVRTEVRGMAAWATKRLNRAEREFARHVVRKLGDITIKDFGKRAIERAVDEAQEALDISLSDEQRDGAIMALSEKISILTGGPGTGKTHTLRVVCEAWNRLARLIPVKTHEQREFALAAPTGKAAKRITETTGYEGRTIHRLLEYKPEHNGFDRNQANPLMVGMICIDESSMPDIFIACDLGRAWGQARVLLIGDIDQLPSVGPGKVLADLLASGLVPHTRLTRIFRQAAGSDIAVGAEEIRQGRSPTMAAPGKGDLVMIDIEEPDRAAERIVGMYAERMPAFAAANGLDPGSIQVLCPGHQSEVGTIALNKAIQERMRRDRPAGLAVKLSDGAEASAGDKVIQLENDYERNIYNGDTGTVVEVEKGMDNVLITHVDFSGAIQTFEGNSLPNLGLAYALSIHKSQGSEYQIVIIPVTTAHWMMLRRTLLYTGTTRAKRLCVYVGTRRAVRTAVGREDSTSRITTLADELAKAWKDAGNE